MMIVVGGSRDVLEGIVMADDAGGLKSDTLRLSGTNFDNDFGKAALSCPLRTLV